MPCCNGLDSRAPPGGLEERTSTRARHRGRVELEVEQTRNPIPRYFSVKSNTLRNVFVLSEIIHDRTFYTCWSVYTLITGRC
jgi:hypothetical protein